jgi:dienelactone hydrolase
MNFKILTVVLVLVCIGNMSFKAQVPVPVTFPSQDGLTVDGDWYPAAKADAPIILLCHQARFSRGEYKEIAPRLNKLGFNCLAIDQRAGDKVNKIDNETARLAREKGMKTDYLDAEQDIVSAVKYLNNKYQKHVIIFGSSYSASLALKVAKENDAVGAVVVFSPAEYFDDKSFVAKHCAGLDKPLFATASKEHSDEVTDLIKDVVSRVKVQYIPQSEGENGSKVLWSDKLGNQEYWIALMSFLNKVKDLH